MKALQRTFAALDTVCYRLMVLVLFALALRVAFHGVDEVIPARLWTLDEAWSAAGVVALFLFVAFLAGRESRTRGYNRAIAQRDAFQSSYESMRRLNSGMVDDLLQAEREGYQTKTFRYGGVEQLEPDVDTSLRIEDFAPGKTARRSDDDRTAGA
jgi:hypothetical protein